jgi:hypothetical protein
MIQIPSMAERRRDHSFDIRITRSAAAAEGEVSPLIIRRLAKLDISLEKGIAMLSKEVQDLVDKSRKQTDVIKSVDAGMGALRKQNEEMKAKLDSIANQPPVDIGQPAQGGGGAPEAVYQFSQEDLDGLREVSKNMDDAIESLKDDIPANTEATKPAPQGGQTGEQVGAGTTAEQQPQVADPKGHQQDSDAASQAKPLDGTGAPTEAQKQDPGA